jgi:hypothetical protein
MDQLEALVVVVVEVFTIADLTAALKKEDRVADNH